LQRFDFTNKMKGLFVETLCTKLLEGDVVKHLIAFRHPATFRRKRLKKQPFFQSPESKFKFIFNCIFLKVNC